MWLVLERKERGKERKKEKRKEGRKEEKEFRRNVGRGYELKEIRKILGMDCLTY